jgi:hypothetical protein
MSIAARDIVAPSGAWPLRGLPAQPARSSTGGRSYVVAGVLCLVLAAISLLFPSTPNYDPWAWVIWGREIVHLNLVTSGGPTWKPLAMIFTTLFAPLGSIAPDLWLIVARAGAIMAIGLMFTLAFRLTRTAITSAEAPSRPPVAATLGLTQAIAPLLAGTIAAVGLLVLSQFVYDEALGYSEGLLLSLTLLAILRHLDGAPLQAFVLGFGASLDRPEIWPLLGLYAIFLWRRAPESRRLVVALLVLIPPLWLLPDLFGSGSLVRGIQYAMYPHGAAQARCPFCTEVTNTLWPLVITPFKIGIVLLIAAATARFARALRRDGNVLRAGTRIVESYGTVLALLAFGIAFCLGEAVLTEAGFSGNNRYVFLGACMIIVAGAVAWARGMTWLSRLLMRFTDGRLGIVAALPVSIAAFVAVSPTHGAWFISPGPTLRALRYQAELREDLPRAVKAAGGATKLKACGTIASNPSNAPLLAWTLGMRIVQLQSLTGNVLGQTRAVAGYPLEPSVPPSRNFHLIADIRTVRIFVDCR